MCKAYTDYPVDGKTSLSHEPFQVVVLSYDNNKYCEILYLGQKSEVKRWYLWEDAEMTIQFDVNRLQNLVDKLELMIKMKP